MALLPTGPVRLSSQAMTSLATAPATAARMIFSRSALFMEPQLCIGSRFAGQAGKLPPFEAARAPLGHFFHRPALDSRFFPLKIPKPSENLFTGLFTCPLTRSRLFSAVLYEGKKNLPSERSFVPNQALYQGLSHSPEMEYLLWGTRRTRHLLRVF